jgi:hypothetical protein
MTVRTHDWRAEFRLHAMDLDPLPTPAPHGDAEHWILQVKPLRSMLASLEKDYQGLRAAGAEPFSDSEPSPQALLARMGYSDCPEPSGLLASAKFTFGFVAACMRQTYWLQSQRAQIRQRARIGIGTKL